MTNQRRNIALLSIGAVIVCALILAWPSNPTSPENVAVSLSGGDATTTPETSTGDTTDTLQGVGVEGSVATPAQTQKTSIVFGYAEAARNQTYYIPWTAQRGSIATITLLQNGTALSTVKNCEQMPIRAGYTSYCAWKPEALEPQQSPNNFSFLLTTYDASGKTLSTARSAAFVSVANFTTSFTQQENAVFGWSVRYPLPWLVKSGAERTVIASDLTGIEHPTDSHEALIVESCSLARETCVTRRETFEASPGLEERALGGKRSLSRSTPLASDYLREDMLLRDGIVFFLTMRTIDGAGTLRSPYLQAVVDSFGYTPLSDTSMKAYEFNGMFSAGGLFIERLHGVISYVRLYAGGEGCKTEIARDTFTKVSGNTFTLMEGECKLSGVLSENAFVLQETNCQSFHSKECSFEGTYTPVD